MQIKSFCNFLYVTTALVFFPLDGIENPYFGVAMEGLPTPASIGRKQEQLGYAPRFIEFYLQWPAFGTSPVFPDKNTLLLSLEAILNAGAVPCVTFEPFYYTDEGRIPVLEKDLTEGKYELYLTEMASLIAVLKKPLIIRFGQEMNLKQYHWMTPESSFDTLSPQAYIRSFKYVVEFFKRRHVDNILWAFCPNADSVPDDAWNRLENYYPGDAYVDILGLDGYNWGKSIPGAQTRSFEQTFRNPFEQLKKLNKDKPIVIFETASIGDIRSKKAWLKDAVKICKQWNVAALIWFDIDKENDWRISLDKELIPLLKNQQSSQEWIMHLLSRKLSEALPNSNEFERVPIT